MGISVAVGEGRKDGVGVGARCFTVGMGLIVVGLADADVGMGCQSGVKLGWVGGAKGGSVAVSIGEAVGVGVGTAVGVGA